ncbi:MAG: DnaB-like helicase C-terminal domain-containing protein [Burkholderiales bacterium]
MSPARPMTAEAIFGALLDAEGPLLKSTARELCELAGLGADDFAEDVRARLLFQAIQRLAEHNRPVDAATVFYAAKAAGPVDVGALEWLQSLQARNNLDRESFEQVARSYRVWARGRAVAAQLRQLAEALEGRTKSPAAVSGELEGMATQLLAEYAPDHTLDEAVAEVFSEWSQAGKPGTRPLLLPTGIAELDQVLGGWAPKLNLVIGQPSTGKSALAGTAIDLQLAAGRKPGLFGLEDGDMWLAKRLVAREMDAPVRDVGAREMSAGQQLSAAEVERALVERTRPAVTYRQRGIRLEDLLRRAVVWVTKHGCDSIWVDNLKLVRPRAQNRDPRYGVSEVLDYLARFAERHKVPVILLAHTKRPGDGARYASGPPLPTDIAETADAERFAFNILALWRKSRSAMRCTVVKAKESQADVTVELDWLAESALVSEAARRVNLGEERRKEAEARDAATEVRQRARREQLRHEAAEWREQRKAEKAKAAEQPELVQASLLPDETKR